MFKSKKIIVRFIALAISFSCLGFTILTAFSGTAYAMKWCRTCDTTSVPGYVVYCSWMAANCFPPPPGPPYCETLTYCPLDFS
jgi:hypothetical protein